VCLPQAKSCKGCKSDEKEENNLECTLLQVLVQVGIGSVQEILGVEREVLPHGHVVICFGRNSHSAHGPVWQTALHLCLPHARSLEQGEIGRKNEGTEEYLLQIAPQE
jgi:hypothetical protein